MGRAFVAIDAGKARNAVAVAVAVAEGGREARWCMEPPWLGSWRVRRGLRISGRWP
jgi:hypothetical protein